jgi:hypothetical protein
MQLPPCIATSSCTYIRVEHQMNIYYPTFNHQSTHLRHHCTCVIIVVLPYINFIDVHDPMVTVQ